MSGTTSKRARLIALYLPQFHPIPENDEWWGPGFTEWTNVAKARPLFRGHEQPHIPGELGFYDLRLPEVRTAQAELAREHGIEAFCYWHYWFGGGRRVLERPFAEVLESGEPNFPFCLAWANQTWTGIWHGASDRVLIEQHYGGRTDLEEHFRSLAPAFHDERYVRVNGRPIFFVYRPHDLPPEFSSIWQDLAIRHGLPGVHLVGMDETMFWDPRSAGFDASVSIGFLPARELAPRSLSRRVRQGLVRRIRGWHHIDELLVTGPLDVIRYEDATAYLVPRREVEWETYPCAFPNWDNTPRAGRNGTVFTQSSPQAFSNHLAECIDFVTHRDPDHRIVIIKSWNEWAEGNYLEPDRRYGRSYLEEIRKAAQYGARRSDFQWQRE